MTDHNTPRRQEWLQEEQHGTPLQVIATEMAILLLVMLSVLSFFMFGPY